ncbi:MAG: metallophosphoesterase [Colwellia sp.]|nr:metallophosphoesterase [Colwellia sp.]
MNILHISDMHFGSRHWKGNREALLNKLNSYAADLVINTGDNTTDALEVEFKAAGDFLKSIKFNHVISIPGNHDKRNMKSQDFFRQYIDNSDVIYPLEPQNCVKKKLFLDQYTTGIKENFTDINFIKKIVIDGKSLLVVCLDTNEVYQDNGFVDKEILRSMSHKIEQSSYDEIILLNHHSILDTDEDPLFNSKMIIDFVKKHKIKDVFCGHTHKLELMKSTDLYNNHSFIQYKNGSLSCCNSVNDSNMFMFYENLGEKDMKIHLIRIFIEGDELSFKDEIITGIHD